jgi:C1A family cysteine protease
MKVPKNVFRVKADRPDKRDFKYNFLKSPTPRKVVDLRMWASPVEDQLQLGSCVGQAIVGAFELMINQLFPEKFVDLSRLFVYYNARLYEGGYYLDEDAGAYVRDGIKAVNKWGVCTETLWPYVIEQFASAPSIQSYEDAKTRVIQNYYRMTTLGDVIDALNSSYPVVISMNVYDSFYNLTDSSMDTLPMPAAREELIGGHAVSLVGYDLNKRLLLARNSFGADWGNNGYFWIPFEYAGKDVMDCWFFTINVA